MTSFQVAPRDMSSFSSALTGVAGKLTRPGNVLCFSGPTFSNVSCFPGLNNLNLNEDKISSKSIASLFLLISHYCGKFLVSSISIKITLRGRGRGILGFVSRLIRTCDVVGLTGSF